MSLRTPLGLSFALFCVPAFALAAPDPNHAPPPTGARAAPGAAKTPAARPGGPGESARWTAATPDKMIASLARRAQGRGADALAAIALIDALSDRASANVARDALRSVGATNDAVGEQARWVAASLEPDHDRASPDGLVSALAILGPFQDTGGRLKERDMPETEPRAWADTSADYSWGVYEVRWRAVAPAHATARGVPLDAYIAPRKESCSYLASRITLAEATQVAIHVASSGSLRLLWDGQDSARSEDVHGGALFDRLGAKVAATAGDHLLAAKVCAGAIDDDGRVRLRLAAGDGGPLRFGQSNDLGPLGARPFAKAAFSSLRELLSSAIEPGAKASIDATIAAAVLRARGGADDLRSPRAPGMLDGLARDASLSADALAIAGWVSPFGAPRSGWLNAARDRAVATGDDETADFASRRLAAARLEAGFADWALAALNAPPFAKDDDPEAAILRASVRSEIGGEPARRAQLTSLLEIAKREGARASSALWSEIASQAHGLDPRVELSARDEVARRTPEKLDLERVRATRVVGKGEDVARAASEALASGSVVDADDLDDIAHNLMLAGRDADARAFLQKTIGFGPNRAPLLEVFSQALFASSDAREKDLAGRALVRARALDPGDAKKRAEVALRTQGSGEGARPRDERWMVDPSVFLARGKAQPARVGEIADRQLHWVRAVTLYDDRRISQLIHYAREIVIAPRTIEELYEQLPAESDDTELIRARVYRPNGDVAFAEEQKSDQGRPMVRWPELKPGDVVEVAIRSWTSGPVGGRGDAPFYFLDYAGSVTTHPILYNEVVVDSPKAKPLAIDVLHGAPDRLLRQDEGARTIARYIWDKPVHFPDEPLAPKPSEVYPTVIGSTFATWGDFRAWYQAAVEGFTEPDEQVRALAAELTKGKRTQPEKLKAIFDFVADDIRYVNYVSGEWWLPNRPQQLLARRQGDCDDKALLLITLLKCVGINATEVLVQTRLTHQPSVLLSEKAAIPLFDHGIAFLPARGADAATWLDATSPASRLGPVPSMDARTFALFVSEGAPKMLPTPAGAVDDYGFTSHWTLRLRPDGAAELEADERHRGDQAFYLRANLREKDARAPWVEQNLIAGWLPQVQVDKDIEFEPELPKGEARVRYRATSQALGRREGQDLVVTLAPTSTLTSRYAPLPKRVLPVVLPPNLAPSSQVYVVRLVAPEGMMPAAELPPGGEELGGEFGRAKLELTRDPRNPQVVLMTRTVTFDADIISVEKYEAWRRWLSRVDSLLHRSVRFSPVAHDAPGGGAPKGVRQ